MKYILVCMPESGKEIGQTAQFVIVSSDAERPELPGRLDFCIDMLLHVEASPLKATAKGH